MFFESSRLARLTALQATLDRTDQLDVELARNLVTHTCESNALQVLTDLIPLMAAGAWTDFSINLVQRRLPEWEITRLCYDDGLWWCSMNPKQPAYWAPFEVDEPHPVLPMAMLRALLTALVRQNCSVPSSRSQEHTVTLKPHRLAGL
jgi:hypothetical protein